MEFIGHVSMRSVADRVAQGGFDVLPGLARYGIRVGPNWTGSRATEHDSESAEVADRLARSAHSQSHCNLRPCRLTDAPSTT